jgi:prephenate dehydrogenase
MRTAAVIGTGLVGTSVALALTQRGVTVYLADNDDSAVRTAASLGAGTLEEPTVPVDLAVIAVPPARVGTVLASRQQRDFALGYTDVASVKARPAHDITTAGGDPVSYVGGHPLAGRERSGPLAARPDLFQGRPWVLTPSSETSRETLNRALEMVSLCGAVPVVMDTEEHDHAVAVVSHAPHVVAALMAARLREASEDTVRIAGQGVRDVTRIAASDPLLWEDILGANALAVADVLAAYAIDLQQAVVALRALGGDDELGRKQGADDLVQLLRRGNAGHARIPGKHGAPPSRYVVVPVVISDAPGELARLFAAVDAEAINIEDVAIEHSPGNATGLVSLSVGPAVADRLTAHLASAGWTVQR